MIAWFTFFFSCCKTHIDIMQEGQIKWIEGNTKLREKDEKQWEGVQCFFVHTADSRNIWHSAIIYSRDLMIPWEVSQQCNESNETPSVCLPVRTWENKTYWSDIKKRSKFYQLWYRKMWLNQGPIYSWGAWVWYTFWSTGDLIGFRCVPLFLPLSQR